MKSLSSMLDEAVYNKTKFHLSFDVIDCKLHFDDNYKDAERFLLKFLYKIGTIAVMPYCASTMIIEYPANKIEQMYSLLEEEISEKFRYLISPIHNKITFNKEDDYGQSIINLWEEISNEDR